MANLGPWFVALVSEENGYITTHHVIVHTNAVKYAAIKNATDKQSSWRTKILVGPFDIRQDAMSLSEKWDGNVDQWTAACHTLGVSIWLDNGGPFNPFAKNSHETLVIRTVQEIQKKS